MIFPKLYQPEKSQPKERRLFCFSSFGDRAYFLNGPNATASTVPNLIQCLHRRWEGRIYKLRTDDEVRNQWSYQQVYSSTPFEQAIAK